jgi:hypothetical protein
MPYKDPKDNKKWRMENKKKNAATKRRYYLSHKEQAKQSNLRWKRNNLQAHLARSLRARLRKGLKAKNYNKVSSAVKELGCSIDDLKKYLESLFQPGMTWKNWSYYGWHIDHIRPLATFDLSNPLELKKACHYTNLQPLWWLKNISKGNKVLLT